jgi:ribosomal protein S18 acetylase RimI-like enzyme
VRRAEKRHLPEIAALAEIIWWAHYPGIISGGQIEYMLKWMYAIGEMERQIDAGTVYERLLADGRLVGFAAHSPTDDPGERKLDKLYIHPDHQRHGYGSRLLNHVAQAAQALGCRSLMLTVNKRNTKAIAAYRKNGFTVREEIAADIGGGFVMDDYVMAKPIRA